jgi:hypothetical protein
MTYGFGRLRAITKPKLARPNPNSATVDGSGVADSVDDAEPL